MKLTEYLKLRGVNANALTQPEAKLLGINTAVSGWVGKFAHVEIPPPLAALAAQEPGKDVLISELMPKILNTQLFKATLDANASEHGARMTAMDKASDNANELLKSLKISYNRARQAAITTELTEIVSGAAALQG